MRLVYGLGRSGLGVLRFLRKRGLPARFYDDRPREEEVREALAWASSRTGTWRKPTRRWWPPPGCPWTTPT